MGIILFLSLQGRAQVIEFAEYFFDIDPGAGNATSFSIPTGDQITHTESISIASLSPGFHFLGIRVMEGGGLWSQFELRGFYITSTVNDASNIVAAEYFFNEDPGVGNGNSIGVVAGESIVINTDISTTSLLPGFNFLAVRTKGSDDRWGVFESRGFYISAAATDVADIISAEYFIDSDPGIGNGIALSIPSGAVSNFTVDIPIESLDPGFHFLAIRAQRADGSWGIFETRGFYVSSDAQDSGEIVAAEYFIDGDDPGEGLANSLTIDTPGSIVTQNFTFATPSLPPGDYILNLRVSDSNNFWSIVETETFTILDCTPLDSPQTQDESRCGEGVLTLTATGATGAEVYRWYADASTDNILFTGLVFETPELTTSTTYFVSTYDPVTLCESLRTEVQAIINFAAKPVVNPSGTLNFCEGNSVLLTAPGGATRYEWSNGQQTQQILVSTSGSYTVQVGDADCLSPPSDPVVVTVVPAPDKPEITIEGDLIICGSGEVVLTGPEGVTYQWSTGASTQSITVSEQGFYFLVVLQDGFSCPSPPSDPVFVTVLTPPCEGGSGPGTNFPPVIERITLTGGIEGRIEFDLTTIISDPENNLDFEAITVVNGATTRGVPAMVDGSFFLIIDYVGDPFTGEDRVVVEACDLVQACAQQVLDIEIAGEVVVYNGLSPDGDGLNDFMLIKYLEVIQGGDQNKVSIFNRWGDLVFEMEGYNNTDKVFTGMGKNGEELPSGTYFYVVEIFTLSKPIKGFLTLVR